MSPMVIEPRLPAPKLEVVEKKVAVTPWGPVSPAAIISKIRNPIREVLAGVSLGAGPDSTTNLKPLLNLSLGDPSVYGNMPPPIEALDAIKESLYSGKSDGYPQSIGYSIALKAVADYFDEGEGGNWRVREEDVVMTHGASGAIDMVFSVLADSTSNVLFPRPLFSAYETSIASTGAEWRYYDLLPDSNWEIDLDQLESLIDDKSAFVIINNPSNPTGTNWSEAHLREIAALAARRHIVVISDEVYAGMAWNVTGPQPIPQPHKQGRFNRGLFTPYASVAGDSPAIILGAVSKRWLAPGWRLGWIIFHDPCDLLNQVKEGCGRWAFKMQAPNSTVQRALPSLFANTPQRFFDETLLTLKYTSGKLFERLSKIRGLKPLLPQGAMYLMCGGLVSGNFGFETDAAFVSALKVEEGVLILPGLCFRLDGFMRFVTTVPLPVLMEACDRIEAFCDRHRME